MKEKVIIICGSPVKAGNTNTVVEWITQGLKDVGNDVELVDSARLKYKVNGCIACMGCQRSNEFKCVIKDRASGIIARIPENDVVIFATPLYFMGPTAQLKLFIDRMYSLMKFDAATGKPESSFKPKTIALVSTAGSDGFQALEQTFKMVAEFSNAQFRTFLVPFAGRSGDLKKNDEVKAKAIAFGRSLA